MLGEFPLYLLGKAKGLRSDFDTHAALTNTAHGAVSTATANKLMARDANGRVQVVSPAASDDSTLVATTAWVTVEIAGIVVGVTSLTAGTGLDGGTITGTGTIDLANTAVAPNSYVLTNLTVDAQGRITAASNGASSITAAAPLVKTGTSTITLSMPAATASVNGYATSTQITKLDNIATNANNYSFTVAEITGQTALGSGLLSTDELLINDGGVLKRIDISVLEDYFTQLRGMTYVLANGSQTFALNDAGTLQYHSSGSVHTYTIPTNAVVAFPLGTVIVVYLIAGSGNVSIAPAGGVSLYIGGATSSATATCIAGAAATIMKVGTDAWVVNGVGVS